MDKSLIKDFYRTIHFDDLTIAYSGTFTDSMTDKIIELSEAYLNTNEKLSKLKKRTSFLVAECFQNVVRHGKKEIAEPSSLLHESFFLRFFDNRCFIASENLMPRSKVNELKSKLDTVNLYDKSELRVLYRSILEAGEQSDAGGAGLGLVEMARKTGNKLEYIFEEKDADNVLFYLLMVLENNPSDETSAQSHPKEFEEIKKVIKNVQQDNMFLLYKGDFEQEIVEYVEKIIEKNLDTQKDSLATKIKLYHASILTMHKIGHFGARVNGRSTGMLFLGRTDSGYLINATFPVEETNRFILEQMLSAIKSSGNEELEKIYQAQLRQMSIDDIPPHELGFTQLSRMGKSWDFAFDTPEGLLEELVFQVII